MCLEFVIALKIKQKMINLLGLGDLKPKNFSSVWDLEMRDKITKRIQFNVPIRAMDKCSCEPATTSLDHWPFLTPNHPSILGNKTFYNANPVLVLLSLKLPAWLPGILQDKG